MPRSRSNFEFRQQASLSQKLAFRKPDYVDIAGSDPQTSLAIQTLKDLIQLKLIDKNNPLVIIALTLLNGQRMALFATSEKVNEITKMGLQMPRRESEYDGDFD